MAKKSKKNKKLNNKSNTNNNRVSKRNRTVKRLVTGLVIIMAAAAAVIYIIYRINDSARTNELSDGRWVPSYANDASGDEVELTEIYNTQYSNYQGALTFFSDGKFSLWLTPGEDSDGTHTGTFKVKSDDEIEAYFDNGTNTVFKIHRTDGEADGISLNYDDYQIYFEKE